MMGSLFGDSLLVGALAVLAAGLSGLLVLARVVERRRERGTHGDGR